MAEELGVRSGIGEWLDHPAGGPVLREILARSGGGDAVLEPIRFLSLARLIEADQGGFTREMATELIERTFRRRLTDADFTPPTAAELRRALLDAHPPLRAISITETVIAGPHGSIPLRHYASIGETRAAYVWIHGGGFVSGDLDGEEAEWVALELAARGIAVVTSSYRKAVNGVSYPVPADDVHAVWQWAVSHAAELARGHQFQLGGASAGAALAAALTVRLRDAGEQQPASLVLVYPIVHPELPERSVAAFEDDFFTPENVLSMSRNYAGSDAALADPHAFAGVAELVGFPATFVLTSETDALTASGEQFAEQLRDAGVAVALEEEPGSIHGHLSHPESVAAQNSIQRIARWLFEHNVGGGDAGTL